ncbi:MAG TPA: isochorismatase family cysteine hydrolase [Polyangiales bacterium]|nr:isochorismatase family cysteine hydrolase [Polyangiales bacterium]
MTRNAEHPRHQPQAGPLRKTADAPKKSERSACLILVDVINGFDFPGSRGLVRAAEQAAPRIERLATRARAAGVPVVYVNDNFGQWRSDFAATVDACMQPDQPGRRVTERLRPHDSDYFVLKPQHSGFYSTTLEPLLEHIGARKLIITGFATNLCVLFTANDAYMRGYEVIVPSDCTASNTAALTRAALEHVRVGLHGRVVASSAIQLNAHKRGT